ncbi:MAG: arsinothricin resistance N-acetyltransferase ArsN1 family A [Bacillota bacterium]
MTILLRPAVEADIEAIMIIHNQGICDRIATLDLEPHTLEQKTQWFLQHGPREPIIVACDEDRVVGFASLSLFSPRACYAHVSSLSIYMARSHRGRGIGKELLGALVELGRAAGYRKIILNAFDFNEAAMALYRSFGFRHVGTYEKQGLLDGRWVDTVIMEKHLTVE